LVLFALGSEFELMKFKGRPKF